ncbi:hypothetical protein McpCs1_05650 [Methanocorpusculaceae archaeon Cs1]|uniref:Uncharacterized protein n=1 Tax=Methanorbis rubei TaxID=3028300 RepID=A0AAE4MDV5_9EURY|nr:hypothetical protein [Methanocorpusculaceae archaeon Cs1]
MPARDLSRIYFRGVPVCSVMFFSVKLRVFRFSVGGAANTAERRVEGMRIVDNKIIPALP